MRNLYVSITGLFLLAFASGCISTATGERASYNTPADWVSATKQGNLLNLADKADVWSQPKIFTKGNAKLEVQTLFVNHQGTTCNYKIYYKNVGSAAVDEETVLSGTAKVEVGNSATTRIKLAPGENVTYNDYQRECPLRWGETKEMKDCAECQPVLYFVR